MKIYNSQFAETFATVEEAVELSVTIEGRREFLRIEALQGGEGAFFTNAYVKRRLQLASADGAAAGKGEFAVWVSYDLPETNRSTANDAIDQTLSFLAERVRAAGSATD